MKSIIPKGNAKKLSTLVKKKTRNGMCNVNKAIFQRRIKEKRYEDSTEYFSRLFMLRSKC